MNIILKLTVWFARKFPKFGLLLSILSLLIPISLTLFFGFHESILMWTIYTEILIVGLSVFFGSINFIFESLFTKTKRRRKPRRDRGGRTKKAPYESFKFTMF